MRKYAIISSFFLSVAVFGQGTNMVYDVYDISPSPLTFLHSDMDLIPGTDTYAVSATQSFPFYIIDGQSMEILNTYDVGNWYGGSRINTSKTGKYILLQQLFYLNYSPNKDREGHFEVIETATGKRVLDIPSAHAAVLHPDEETLIVLAGDQVYGYPLNGKEKRKLFPVPAATNCVAISPDGNQIAISHHVENDYLNAYVTKKRQKKNFKIYKKYRQCISVYDAHTFERSYTVDEMFDLPYVLDYSPTGDYLICYAVPHTKVVKKTGMQGTKYISKIIAATGETTKVGFISNSDYVPDIEFNSDGSKLAIVSNGTKFPEVWVCDFNDGSIIDRFELATRMFQTMKLKEMPGDAGRIGVTFSPDDQHLLFTNGTRIIKWKINYER